MAKRTPLICFTCSGVKTKVGPDGKTGLDEVDGCRIWPERKGLFSKNSGEAIHIELVERRCLPVCYCRLRGNAQIVDRSLQGTLKRTSLIR